MSMVKFNFCGDILPNEYAEVWRHYGENNNVCPDDIRQLCENAAGDDIVLYINSDGGAVVAGTEMYSILKEYSGKVTAHIQSRAASSATIVMMACDRIVAEPVSLVLIHNPWTTTEGDAETLRMSADELDNVKQSIMNAYAGRMGRERDEISALMDRGVWLDAVKAKENGLVDEVLSAGTASENFANAAYHMMYPSQKMMDEYRSEKQEKQNRIAQAKAFLENYR